VHGHDQVAPGYDTLHAHVGAGRTAGSGQAATIAQQTLRTWLANVELSADRSHRGNSVRGELLDEQPRRLFL
jgi:hypothetical protein